MTRSKDLHDLQALDRRRDEDLRHLREVMLALRDDAGVSKARQALDEAERALEDVERRLRKVEAARDDLKASVSRDEQHLYQGKSMHPKEIEGQRMALASHRRQLEHRDDEALELMVERDESRLSKVAAEEALARVRQEAERRQESLMRERGQLARAIKGAEPTIERARGRIPAGDLSHYDRLRKSPALHGLAVATLDGDVCQGCGQQLPRNEAVRSRGQEALVSCPGCGRLVHG